MTETATRAAILGLLGLKPWRSYELVKEMGRNLRFFWPRAESRIYAELQRLQTDGLAEATTSHVGDRPRQTWKRTRAGKAALGEWFRTPSAGTTLQSEDLLRVFLADPDDHATLSDAIANVRREALELRAVAERIAAEYGSGTAPFQARVRSRALVFDFLSSWAQMRLDWAERSERYLASITRSSPEAANLQGVDHIERRWQQLREGASGE